MSQTATRPMTPEAFLEWEERQEFRWEWNGVRPEAMNGVSVAHSTIQTNLTIALGTRLRGTGCRAHGPSLMLEVGRSYRYPDLFVVCSPTELSQRRVSDARVVFEILSPSTARNDRTVKVREYTALPSLLRYVMLEQDQAFATVISRTDTGWMLETLTREGVLAMPEIGVEVPLADIYEGLDFPPLEDDGR